MSRLSACTNLIVGKKASADGSVMVTYSDDSFGKYGYLCHFPAGVHEKGAMKAVYDWETRKYLGEIPEAPQTFQVVGNINEFQLCICESTFGGREELCQANGIMDYGNLIYTSLQRCKSAREAIQLMDKLAQEYGYFSTGESFSICDKNEAWIMEMIGKGKNSKGAVWVAVRIPDDCISGHANQSRITTFALNDKDNCLYSQDVISFAREKGYFSGKDEDFSFREAYDPIDFNGIRHCDARIWSFFRKFDLGMDEYLPYIDGDRSAPNLPLYIHVDHKVSLRELKNAMRDHYEGTMLDMTSDVGAGGWLMPYRPSPNNFTDATGTRLFHERPIATQQTAFTLVSQLRNWLPDAVGGLMWFGADDSNMIAYVPVYCSVNQIPTAFARETSNATDFNMKSAYWLCNLVSNFVYPRYSTMMPDLRKVQKELEDSYENQQKKVEQDVQSMDAISLVAYLNKVTNDATELMMEKWTNLFGYLVVKHNDMAVKLEEDGKFDSISDEKVKVKRPGYAKQFYDFISETTGTRYRER
ncbi:MAG: C69 family dipeptidase [Bacteroidales bacterium]|nr:C69 family dipeptidase [Bacteroidales bacterium]